MAEEEIHHKTELAKKIKEGAGDDSDDEDPDVDDEDNIINESHASLLALCSKAQLYANAFKEYSFLHSNPHTRPPEF